MGVYRLLIYVAVSASLFSNVGCGGFHALQQNSKFAAGKHGSSFASQSIGGPSISAPVLGDTLTISTSARTAGAIDSLTFRGKEYINADDHGRELQSASSYDGWGECLNPTEAGSEFDGAGGVSTSQLLGLYNAGNVLRTTTRMAYWLRAGQAYPQGCQGKAVTENGVNLSNDVLSKDVTIGYAGMENVIQYLVNFKIAEHHTSATLEALTGYMPPEFSSFYAYDPGADNLYAVDRSNGEQGKPLILATHDNANAMGIYAPDMADDGLGYGKFYFTGATAKWNAVFRRGFTPPGDYSFRMYVAVGTVEEVRAAIRELNRRFHPPAQASVQVASSQAQPSLPPPPPVSTKPQNAIYRFYSGSTGEHFLTGFYDEGANAGYHFDGIAFHLFSAHEPGSIGLYRCRNSDGKHFTSTDPGCEGQAQEGNFGYLYTGAVNGTMALYRFYLPGNGDHLTTTDFSEGAAAGYVFEATLGYVPY